MRALVVPKLRDFWPGARIIHELPLRYSTRRIDLAAVTRDAIVAVEIKSSADTIDRLEAQLRGFAPIAHVLVCALAPKWNPDLPMLKVESEGYSRWVEQISETQKILRAIDAPIETWTVDAERGALDCPSRQWRRVSTPWTWRLLHILHRAELIEIAARHRVSASRDSNHLDLVDEIARMLTGREAVAAACRALRNRDAFDRASDPPTGDA